MTSLSRSFKASVILISAALCTAFGRPDHYTFKGSVVYPRGFEIGFSTFQNTGQKKADQANRDSSYSSMLPAILLSQLKELRWVYREKLLPRIIRHEHHLPLRKADPDSYERQSRAVAYSRSGEVSSLETGYVRLLWPDNVLNTSLSADSSIEKVRKLCLDNNVEMLLYGSYQVKGTRVKVTVALYSLVSNSVSRFEYDLSIQSLRDDLVKSLAGLQKNLSGLPLHNLSVTSPVEEARVYINGVYIGQTPVTNRPTVQGTHVLRLEKTGYTAREFLIKLEEQKHYRVDLPIEIHSGTVSITSNPPGARVYMGVMYSGRTPLKISGVPGGSHRIHLRMDGYIDAYRTIKVSKEEASLQVQLEEGDSREYYKIKDRFWWRLTWFDMAAGSFGLATASLIGVFAFQAKEEQTLDRLRSQVPLNIDDFSAADYRVKKQYEETADSYAAWAAGMQVSTAAFMGLALYFFIKYIRISDIDIAFNSRDARPGQVTVASLPLNRLSQVDARPAEPAGRSGFFFTYHY